MTTDFRALCAELVDQLKRSAEVHWNYACNKAARQCDAAVERARTALAEPEPEEPTLQPVPVSERLPGPEDCDAEGRCWFFFLLSNDSTWTLEHHMAALCSGRSHWLPAHALPLTNNTGRSS